LQRLSAQRAIMAAAVALRCRAMLLILSVNHFERLDMKVRNDANGRWRVIPPKMLLGITLALGIAAPCALAQSADSVKPAEGYEVIYLTNISQMNDANEIQTAVRNMVGRAKIYYVPAQNALLIRGIPEDLQLAQKIVADLNRTKKSYRLTYTITELEGSKRVATQHVAVIVIAGAKTVLKQGSRVPIITGTFDAGTSTQNQQVQYVDVGLNIEASVDDYADGVRLRTKVEQSSPSEEKSGVGPQNPVIRQTSLEATSVLTQGKSLVLGSLDLPGGTRHEDIEVVSEPVK